MYDIMWGLGGEPYDGWWVKLRVRLLSDQKAVVEVSGRRWMDI